MAVYERVFWYSWMTVHFPKLKTYVDPRVQVGSREAGPDLRVSRHEGAGRHTLGRNIGIIERIEHRPQHVALEFQRAQYRTLCFRRGRVALDIVEREVGVPPGKRWALVEIRQCIGADEVIVLEHAFHALGDDARRE